MNFKETVDFYKNLVDNIIVVVDNDRMWKFDVEDIDFVIEDYHLDELEVMTTTHIPYSNECYIYINE
jgi:hypothetical protein